MSAIEDPTQQFTSRRDFLVKWTGKQEKLCKQLLSSQTIQENVLTQLLEMFQEDPRFDFGGLTVDNDVGVIGLEETHNITKKRLQASQLFLDVWKYLIIRIDMISINHRLLCYKLILLLIKRREFHPKYFQNLILNQITKEVTSSSHTSSDLSSSSTETDLSFLKISPTFNPNNQTQKKGFLSSLLGLKKSDGNDELSKKVLLEYKELLIRTQDFVINQVLKTKKHENIVVELMRFCASVLAVNCFRLLSADQTETFVSSLCLKQFDSDFVEPETVEIVNSNLDIKKRQFSKNLKYVPSQASLSTLLYDSDEEENALEKEPQEDEEKSYVHKTALCYFKFFFEIDPLNDTNTKAILSKMSDWMKNASVWVPTSKVSGDFFNYFFSEFVDQISKIMKHDTSNKHWQLVPGYTTLVTNFTQLGEIYLKQHININFSDAIVSSTDTTNKQEQKIQRLEESARGEDGHESIAFKQWLSCSLIALRNPRVINILMEIFFSNTNGYNPDQVFYTLDWTDKWFEEVRHLEHQFQQYLLYRNQKHQHTYFYLESNDSNIELFIGSLPENFNFEFFETAISRLLETDHFQIVSRTLIFVYNILDLFNGKARMKFIGHDLLRDRFYHLFLHWSGDIRSIFQRIVLFKLQRYSSSVFSEFAPLSAIPPDKSKKFEEKPLSPSLGGRDRSNSNSLTPPTYEKKRTIVSVEDTGIRRSLDMEPRRTSISGTRPSVESIVSYSSSKMRSSSSLKKKNKKVVRAEESVDSEFQRVEESIDLVLKSKVETFIQTLKSVQSDPKTFDDLVHDNPSLDIPKELIVYVGMALEEFEALQKEADNWKTEVASLLLANKKASKVKLSQTPYPRINFPRFTLQSDKL